jgi:PHS family inorganic phosphate transporter-like MFS transporter
MAGHDASPPGAFAALDDSRITRFQWKIMFVSGMGFFTDAYDLFVIGIVVVLLKPEWGLSTTQVSLLNSVTLAASAFAPNFWFLLVCRAVLGVGIGGDYPVSATIMSEYSGQRTRGKMVGLVFAMQGAGLLVGPLLAAGLLASGLSDDIVWRVLLAFGALPGLAVFYLRRQIHETPRFALAGGAADEAEAAIRAATKSPAPPAGGSEQAATAAAAAAAPAGESAARVPQGALEGFAILARHRRMLLWLIGTAGAWALLDFCYYGNSISTPEILALLNPGASLLHNTLVQLGIFAVFAVPGYLAAILLLDRAGRRKIQLLGFGMMALAFGLIGLIPAVSVYAVPFILLYGASYFFTEFGPNTTTFVYPAEIFPVHVRTTAHGLSAGAGKLGAFAGAYLFPVLLASSLGIRLAEIVAAAVALAGLVLTVALLPEPKGRSLEDLSAEALAPPAPRVLERAA